MTYDTFRIFDRFRMKRARRSALLEYIFLTFEVQGRCRRLRSRFFSEAETDGPLFRGLTTGPFFSIVNHRERRVTEEARKYSSIYLLRNIGIGNRNSADNREAPISIRRISGCSEYSAYIYIYIYLLHYG
ncbi:hypothetical protein V1477_013683 [Vespula maculifrons]|uniref:Uncharacterized protein n=1 Tax=Vespula maculifrons TaxID=7453 RepID=A0ABD2BNZ4_VESMC